MGNTGINFSFYRNSKDTLLIYEGSYFIILIIFNGITFYHFKGYFNKFNAFFIHMKDISLFKNQIISNFVFKPTRYGARRRHIPILK